MADANRNPNQTARDRFDAMFDEAGWTVQSKNSIDFAGWLDTAFREYRTDIWPADYVLFIDKQPLGVVESKPVDWGQAITTVEDQSTGYATATLKYLNNKEPLLFLYESTGVVTHFTDRHEEPRKAGRAGAGTALES